MGSSSVLSIAISAIAALLGSGIATAFVSYFLERRLSSQLERLIAHYQRSTAVHANQVQALLSLHCGLTFILRDLSSLNISLRHVVGEAPDPKKFLDRCDEVKTEFEKVRLILSENITGEIDHFFEQLPWVSRSVLAGIMEWTAIRALPPQQEHQRTFNPEAIDSMIYNELYPLLQRITSLSRDLIHVEPPAH